MLPTSPEDPGAAEGERTAETIAGRDIPALCLWADSDPIIPFETGRAVAARLGLPEPEKIPDASHFLQEDQGRMIGERIAEWLGDVS
jgi:haloalkane dehalogenase